MDAKITLAFDKEVIERAKNLAAENNISLSRMVEFMLRKATSKSYQNLEEFSISEWVKDIAEGEAEYSVAPKSRKKLREDFYKSKKRKK